VAGPEPDRRFFRFGLFELDCESGELRKEGKAQPRLRDQALRILLMLLERPRDVVTREELRARLWPADTFVDFDHGMNSAINQLRNALGDTAANPRFIQTLPRRGYRFIAPLELESRSVAPGAALGGATSVLSDARDLPAVSRGVVRILFSLIQVMYLIFYILSLARLAKVEAILSEVGNHPFWIVVLLIIMAAIGIPVRLYLLAATGFNYDGLKAKFLKLFPFLFPLDEIWALAPFLIVHQTGIGLAIGMTAALVYVPFAQRSLLLMGFSGGA